MPGLAAVPGLGLGAESWRRTLASLGVRPAVVHEFPGYGVPVPSGRVPPPAELARILLDRLTAPTTLLGHSASCQVVAHAARLRPDLVERLVLVGPTTDPRTRSWPALLAVWLRTAGHEDPWQLPQLVRQYGRTTLRSILRTMDVARHDDIAATLAEVRCPVVLVRGAHDRIARRDWLEALAGTGPSRVVLELPGGAHMVPITRPGLLAGRLRPVLEGGPVRP